MLAYKMIFTPADENSTLQVSFNKELTADNDTLVKDVSLLLDELEENASFAKGCLLINGPQSLPIAYVIAHRVAHRFATVAVADPELQAYIVVMSHGGDHRIGDLIPM